MSIAENIARIRAEMDAVIPEKFSSAPPPK